MKKIGASFRDPSGYIFKDAGHIYRRVNKSYKKEFDLLISSGLYDELTKQNLLIEHKDVSERFPSEGYKTIQPKVVPFISYPYEWSFTQLKDAALTTLEIQKIAIEKEMTLKDASAYNIQFLNGKPIFIDTLSFEKYEEGKPWVAYKQFCQHFLAPLMLMSFTDVRLSSLLRTNIDGIPLDLADELLPGSARLKPSVKMHISMQAKLQSKYADKSGEAKVRKVSKFAMLGLISSLEKAVTKLEWKPEGTEWGEYYTFTNYHDDSFEEKKKIIKSYIEKANPKEVWDVGANNGLFSRIASDEGIFTVASDIDPAAVEFNYLHIMKNKEKDILPLIIDLTNPSPDIGWSNNERDSFVRRGPADMVFALALIHHLAISNNVPLDSAAEFFAKCGEYLVIEFVSKDDSQVKKLLATREDIFDEYTVAGFEKAFKNHFEVIEKTPIKKTNRILYLLKKT